MKNLQQSFEHHIHDLSWSLWTELGVPGVIQYHANYAIDPEALIAWSSSLRLPEPRLQDLTQAWYQKYNKYISMSRLRSLHKIFNQGPLDANTILAPKVTKKVQPRLGQKTSKHISLQFNQPANIVLRCRAFFGVTARSDMVVQLLFNKGKSMTAAKLAQQISLTKLNVSDILHDLQKVGLCVVQREGNADIYYLTRHEPLRVLLGPWPSYFPLWKNIFSFLSVCIKIIQTSQKLSPQVAAIDAHKDLLPWFTMLQTKGVEPPINKGDLNVYWNDINNWILKTTAELANGTSRLLTT